MTQKKVKRQNVIVATGLPKINNLFFGHKDMQKLFTVLEVVENRNDIQKAVAANPTADIVLVSDGLTGKGKSLSQIMIDVHLKNPTVRVVYLTSEVKRSQMNVRMRQLGYLVRTHMYDIVAETPITMKHIFNALMVPATEEDVAWIFKYIDEEEEVSAPQEKVQMLVTDETEIKSRHRGTIKNLHVFSSIKPGTGKSFIAANIATAIAKYGKPNEHGERPRVALIDGDMQNLSIGTLLQVEDNEKNLKTVMDKVRLILDDKGMEIDNPALVANTKAFVRSAFLPYDHVKNLSVLAGSQLRWEDVQTFKQSDFTWLIQTIQKDFDVIIMDSSSSLSHVSTLPMMLLASDLFYILNLDFNNIRNNSRYQADLERYGVLDKVKYILNENINKSMMEAQGWKEGLLFDDEAITQNGFNLVGSIPVIEKPTFLNRIFIGEPVTLDDQPHTLEARLAVARIANQIWEIERLDHLEDQYERYQLESGQGKRKGLFGRK